jgi:hypothetical protein
MEDFQITTRLTEKEYIKIMFIGLYKKPVFILATLIGLVLFTQIILYYFFDIGFYSETPWFEIIAGAFLLLFPSVIVFISVKQLKSNPSFQDDINYTFGENEVVVQGLTFKGEYAWAHIIKQKEIGKFLVLYHSKRFGNFIDKTKLTPEQLQFIKSKVKTK